MTARQPESRVRCKLHARFGEGRTEKGQPTVVGTSPAVVSLSGILVRGLSELEVECLPGDLIKQVEADLSVLKEIGTSLHVRDLVLPQTIKVLTDVDE